MTVECCLYVFGVLMRDLRDGLGRSLQTIFEIFLNLIFNRSLIEEVINLHNFVLSIAIDATDTLLNAHRIPWQIVINADVAELKVNSFTSGFGRNEKAGLRMIAKQPLTCPLS